MLRWEKTRPDRTPRPADVAAELERVKAENREQRQALTELAERLNVTRECIIGDPAGYIAVHERDGCLAVTPGTGPPGNP